MNAPAYIARYRPTVAQFLPAIDDESARLRCGILYLRDKASGAERVARWEASTVLAAIASIATQHAFTEMPLEQLETVHASLVRMMMAATALEVRGPGSDGHGA